MPTAQFRQNRAAFPLTELIKYQGKWIAFDPDGTKVIAVAKTIAEVDQLVQAAGYDPEEVAFEGVPGPGDDDLDNGAIT
jgi:Family of unknown function (DUF5678)